MLCKIDANKDVKTAGNLIKSSLSKSFVKVVHVVNGLESHDFWIECAKLVGKFAPMEENYLGDKTGEFFTDIKYPWKEQSNSFSHSNTRQPLHTDGSYESNAPQITFFCCKESPKYGGSTIFIDLKNLKSYLLEYSPSLFYKLENEIVTHSKGKDKKTRKILDGSTISWNFFRCEECQLRNEFNDFLENYIIGGNLFESVNLKIGDALFFKDEEILHGRNSFIGNRWLIKGGLYV